MPENKVIFLLASYPGCMGGEKKQPGINCLGMHGQFSVKLVHKKECTDKLFESSIHKIRKFEMHIYYIPRIGVNSISHGAT